MIINSAPKNEAIVSNVGEIGEFRIQQSAEAFGILSSGLYANKIRAVIRELSCNAVDSHQSAGKMDTPFDVHLPNTIEPWFAVRDYGVGLDHAQITKIYTTYFMSTKGDSNDQIGGLGLGSKSPFSYTDNFTVTTTKDGVKGIYTAFINEIGVPSIALMETAETDDPNGVEVKFGVDNQYDFGKFEQETRIVFRTFKLRPVVSGCSRFSFTDTVYTEKDVVPGVHYTSNRDSIALMGNVPYPIDVPNPDANLGGLRSLLGCGLELEFAIGEIKFQASREGLSYVPETIAAIKAKLQAVNDVLTSKIAAEADAITCLYARQTFLATKFNQKLYEQAVKQYVATTKFPLVDPTHTYGFRETRVRFDVTDLASKYNIKISGFYTSSYYNTLSNIKANWEHSKVKTGDKIEYWSISLRKNLQIAINDTKIGALERVKFNWRGAKAKKAHEQQNVYILNRADSTKEMDTAGFLKALYNPPSTQVELVSSLAMKSRAGVVATGLPVSVLKLVEKDQYSRFSEMVWRDAGAFKDINIASRTFYYMPLKGYIAESKMGRAFDAKDMMTMMRGSGIPGLSFEAGTIYGVRKANIEAVKKLKNWVNLEDHIEACLAKLDDKFWLGATLTQLDDYSFLRYNKDIESKVAADSFFLKVFSKFSGVTRIYSNASYVKNLLNVYAPKMKTPGADMLETAVKECKEVFKKYPLLRVCSHSSNAIGSKEIAEYINLIDQKVSI